MTYLESRSKFQTNPNVIGPVRVDKAIEIESGRWRGYPEGRKGRRFPRRKLGCAESDNGRLLRNRAAMAGFERGWDEADASIRVLEKAGGMILKQVENSAGAGRGELIRMTP